MADMPTINVESLKNHLDSAQMEIAKACLGRNDRLRASKPKDGFAAYVWRMVAFQVSPNSQHHCRPMTAEYGFPSDYFGRDAQGSYEESSARRKAKVAELTLIVDAMVETLPKSQWHGVKRWGRALGQL